MLSVVSHLDVGLLAAEFLMCAGEMDPGRSSQEERQQPSR